MKIRVYYGETNGYDYVTFVLGNMFITSPDIIDDIYIERENIPQIINNIDFDCWDWKDFLDCYYVTALDNFKAQRTCGILTVNELSEMLLETEKICESEEQNVDVEAITRLLLDLKKSVKRRND